MVYQEGQMESIRNILAGKKGLIVGIANENSIAYGCASVLRDLGAEFAVTYLNQKAEKYVRPLADQLGSPLVLPLDVEQPGQMEAVFEAIRQQWGKLDFVIHSIAFCPMDDLHGRASPTARSPVSSRRCACPAIPSSKWPAWQSL
ncbi:SDR family oxidoreductase [Chromobacterium haemolyticum]|nr:SDR family oxidoreductase [Chromobacterium haemolyticum]